MHSLHIRLCQEEVTYNNNTNHENKA